MSVVVIGVVWIQPTIPAPALLPLLLPLNQRRRLSRAVRGLILVTLWLITPVARLVPVLPISGGPVMIVVLLQWPIVIPIICETIVRPMLIVEVGNRRPRQWLVGERWVWEGLVLIW